jgi:prepilin-type processing-associated H-X9-DG protein
VKAAVLSRAFALVELLVVIALIALLVGILVPVISRVRVSAASTACQNNLRSIGQASHTRAAEAGGYVGLAGLIDHDGFLPSADLPSQLLDSQRRRYQYLSPVASYSDLKGLPFVLAEYMSRASKSGDHGEALSLASTANANVLRVFRCPGQPAEGGTPRGTHQLAHGLMLIYPFPLDYGFNGGIFGFHPAPNSQTRRARGRLTSLRSDTVVLACDIARDPPGIMAVFTPVVPGSGVPVTLADALAGTSELVAGGARPIAPHRGRVNIVFADGHVSGVGSDKLAGCRLSP